MQQSPSIWTLSDGHAGNVRQAQALATALAASARDWTLAPRAPWRWAAPRALPGAAGAFGDAFAQLLAQRGAESAASDPMLAIGCGRQAALATRLLRQRGAQAVQILDPRIDTRHWDLVIAPAHDDLHGENVITLTGSLNPVDDLWLAAARSAFAAFAALPQPRTALLLGGPSAHAAFDDRLFDDFLRWLESRLQRDGGSILATTSRRTPIAAHARLRERLGKFPGVVWCDGGDGVNPYPGLLGWADRIICTADSVNMLSEAAATNAPVFAAGVPRISGRPRRFVNALIASGRVHACDDALDGYAVTPLRETARVAALVRQRLQA
ncbi:mitochondrial fission ELM1 family protein [Lysobacter fragariae]